MKRNSVLFIHMSDTHIDGKYYPQLQKEFYNPEGILDQIRNIKNVCKESDYTFGGMIYEGDYWNTKVLASSKEFEFGIDLMNSLTSEILDDPSFNDSKFIILRGTFSHDYHQLNAFKGLEKVYKDRFVIVDKPMEFNFKGYDILTIPEEYGKDINEAYGKYFNSHYDLFCMHGFFKYNCFDGNAVEKSLPEMYIFDQNVVKEMATLTIAGHDHHHHNHEEKIYYNGSTSRLCHGDEIPKGFLVTILHDDNNHDVVFVENTLAPKYTSIRFSYVIDKYAIDTSKEDFDIHEIIKTIEDYKERNSIDYLKLIVYEDDNISKDVVGVIKTYFATSVLKKYIILEYRGNSVRSNVRVEQESNTLAEEEYSETSSEYDYLFDSQIPLSSKIDRFIQQTNDDNENLPSEDFIRSALTLKS